MHPQSFDSSKLIGTFRRSFQLKRVRSSAAKLIFVERYPESTWIGCPGWLTAAGAVPAEASEVAWLVYVGETPLGQITGVKIEWTKSQHY